MTTNAMPTYEELFRPIKQDGHKVYRNLRKGRIELADYSGTTPDRTDDGPLVVANGAVVELDIYKDGLVAIVPVTVERDDDRAACVWTTYGTAKALKECANVTFKQGHKLAVLSVQLAELEQQEA